MHTYIYEEINIKAKIKVTKTDSGRAFCNIDNCEEAKITKRWNMNTIYSHVTATCFINLISSYKVDITRSSILQYIQMKTTVDWVAQCMYLFLAFNLNYKKNIFFSTYEYYIKVTHIK